MENYTQETVGTGAPRWEIEADKPMIETVYYHNDSDPEAQPA